MIEFAEVSNLPSQPPVIKVFDFMLQVHKVAAGPEEEGAEPGRDRLDGVFLAMPHCVSLCIQIDNVRGLIRALSVMIAGNLTIFQPLDPLGGVKDSIADGNVEMGDSPVVLDVPVRRSVECVFIVLDMVVEPTNLFLEAVDFASFLGVASSDGCEEPFSNGLEDVCIEIGVGCQGGCNCTRRHRWFWTLDQSDQERDAVLGGQGI